MSSEMHHTILDEYERTSSIDTFPLRNLCVHLLWITTCSVALLSTAMLIHIDHVVHPFTLLLTQTFSAFALSALSTTVFDKTSSKGYYSSSTEIMQSNISSWSRLYLCMAMLPSILSWILIYAALSTTHNPFTIVMVAGLNLHQAVLQPFRSRTIMVSVIYLMATAFVLRYDYRLIEQSLWLQVAIIIALNLAQLAQLHMHNTGRSMHFDRHHLRQTAYIVSLPILCTLAIAEHKVHGSIISRSPSYSLSAINIISAAIAIALGDHLSMPIYTLQNSPNATFDAPLVVGVFGVAYHVFGRDSMIPPAQIIAYAIASLCSTKHMAEGTLNRTDAPKSIPETIELSDDEEDGECERHPYADAKKSNAAMAGCLSVLTAISWLFLLLQSLGLLGPLLSPAPAAHLDQHYAPEASIDFVVAYYDESVLELGQTLQAFLALQQTREVQRRVFLYNKGSSASHEDLESGISGLLSGPDTEVRIIHRPNQGRESETYLMHILDEWDDLATHTVFMQASPHEPQRAVLHLGDYLVPETGFLSLSYASNFCGDCSSCRDHSSWIVDPMAIHWIYDLAYKGSSSCQNIPLTYRGQFVVSAARIRGGGQDMYQQLHSALVDDDPEEDLDQPARKPSKGTTSDDYGYLLERMWSVVMQCADEWVADRCPSLLSNTLGMLGDVRDCQCLDENSGLAEIFA